MSTNVIQSSFASGELSSTLFARVDLAQYKNGLARCRNFFVDYRSGASTRPGTEFIARCKISSKKVRLLPFEFSVLATYILEFGDRYMRIYLNGAQVTEPPLNILGISQGNPATVVVSGAGYSNGNEIVINGLTSGPTALNGKNCLVVGSGNTFTITDLDGTPVNTLAMPAYAGGGTTARIAEISTPYAAEDLALIKFTQTANVMTLAHNSYPPKNLTRTQHWAWSLTDIDFSSPIASPTGVSASSSNAGGTPSATFSYVVTAIDANGNESQPSNVASVTGINIAVTAGTNTISWNPVSGAVSYNVYKAELSTGSTPPIGSAFGFIGSTQGLSVQDSNILPNFTLTPPQHRSPFSPGQIIGFTVTAGGTGGGPSTTISISDPTGSGAILTPIINSGALVGALIVNSGENYTSPTVVLSNITGASATVQLGPQTGTYPGCTEFFQQRQCFGNTLNQPSTFFMSQPGSYNNFDVSQPTQANDAITATIVAKQVNAIKHMIPMPGGLVVLTAQGAWQISGGGGGINNPTPITPADAQAVPQAYIGASDVPPLIINYDILYVQSRGSVVRDLTYNLYFNIYAGTDISLLSNHLFFGRQIMEWCYAQEPYKIVWAVRDDGVLLSLTFLKEQQIVGWARHDTFGQFKSVATIVESVELLSGASTQVDSVYFVVQRTVTTSAGVKTLQYVERMSQRDFTYGVEDARCVDSSVSTVLPTPAANLTASASAGTGVTFTADAAVFTSGDVGKTLRMGGGIATITAFNSSTSLIGDIIQDIQEVTPNDPLNTPLPALSGTWSLASNFTTFSGLDHLEGLTVTGLADGQLIAPQVVASGTITLPAAASKVTVGLPFTAELQTLKLDIGEAQGGTIQGKRKRIAAVTIKQNETRGLKVGRTFDTLVDVKKSPAALGVPVPLVNEDERVVLDPLWDTEGQICIRQDWPLPATVLGVVPEILIGDTVK